MCMYMRRILTLPLFQQFDRSWFYSRHVYLQHGIYSHVKKKREQEHTAVIFLRVFLKLSDENLQCHSNRQCNVHNVLPSMSMTAVTMVEKTSPSLAGYVNLILQYLCPVLVGSVYILWTAACQFCLIFAWRLVLWVDLTKGLNARGVLKCASAYDRVCLSWCDPLQ